MFDTLMGHFTLKKVGQYDLPCESYCRIKYIGWNWGLRSQEKGKLELAKISQANRKG
jgi:hypothetical protein